MTISSVSNPNVPYSSLEGPTPFGVGPRNGVNSVAPRVNQNVGMGFSNPTVPINVSNSKPMGAPTSLPLDDSMN